MGKRRHNRSREGALENGRIINEHRNLSHTNLNGKTNVSISKGPYIPSRTKKYTNNKDINFAKLSERILSTRAYATIRLEKMNERREGQRKKSIVEVQNKN